MTPDQDSNPLRRDPLDGYVAGDRDAVDAARPDEPTEAEWDAARRRIHNRLNPAAPAPLRRNWRAAALLAAGAAITAVAATVAWVAFNPAPQPEVADTRPGSPAQITPLTLDPLADFAVLPMATADEVDLRRVPGSGWFPVGPDPLPGVLSLATTDEVELDDPNPAWPQVTLSPGDAPMIFAAKPR